MPQFLTSFRTAFFSPVQYKCWWIITSVLSSPVWRRYAWYRNTAYILGFYVITVLFLHFTRLWIVLLPLRKSPLLYAVHLSLAVRMRYFHLYWSWKHAFKKLIDAKKFWYSYHEVIILVYSLLIPNIGQLWKRICHHIFLTQYVLFLLTILFKCKSPY